MRPIYTKFGTPFTLVTERLYKVDAMIKILRVFCILFITMLNQGCSSNLEIEGDAFIDSSNKVSKLALVKIQVAPYEKFVAHINKLRPRANEKVISLKAEQLARANRIKSLMDGLPNSLLDDMSRIVAMHKALSDDNAREIQLLETGVHPLYFEKDIDGALQTTETNADGKFKLKLRQGEKVVLIGAKDPYVWALWITAEKSKPTITLSNKNHSSSECSDCVFGGKITLKSITGG